MTKKPTNRDLQAEERRKQLLQASKELFAKQGFHATPIRSINRSIGMADGLIYHYFPKGKQQILETIVEDSFTSRSEILAQQLSGLITKEVPLKQALIIFIERMNEMVLSDQLSALIMFRERAYLSDDFVEKLGVMIINRLDWLANFLNERHEAGEIEQLDFQIAAKQITSINFILIVKEMLGLNVILESKQEFIEKSVDQLVKFWEKK
ncbi:TetR/AcrR family transcriptional regulator [Chengkuizengella axinellae]|uniref:TetR/AcrR family transcriptional regulator n=1 Tax=Chengkuizengella axinellae TaxID=3064388 RepID=A0ABT9IZ78_9BACL|nr:TetR/AcrR family transcriptional regulator [Chengkuizengella sp. 2205SS18-9]MDP5274623.1 TetR/AcrR family transcriptional regulator [Chengkuizengella sp. 2205SS18-9]